MAPNCKDRIPVKTLAAVFNDDPNDKSVPNPNFDPNADVTGYVSLARETPMDTDGVVVSNTLARYSYQLDRYLKNIMVIFQVSSSEESCLTVDSVKDCFKKFRFEIETYKDVTGDDVKAICEEFFKRDFKEYGAVALLVLAPLVSDQEKPYRQEYSTIGSSFGRADFMKYLSRVSTPPTLQAKPKIFMSQEGEKLHSIHQTDFGRGDLIEIYFTSETFCYQSLDNPQTCSPLRYLCSMLEEWGDQESFQEIVGKVIKKTNKARRPHTKLPVCLTSECGGKTKAINFWRTI